MLKSMVRRHWNRHAASVCIASSHFPSLLRTCSAFGGNSIAHFCPTAGSVVVALKNGGIVCFAGEVRPPAKDRLLSSPLCMTIGPFPESSVLFADRSVKEAFERIDPPMREIDFQAEYDGADGKKVRWQYDDRIYPIDLLGNKAAVSFRFRNGVTTGGIAYAVTFIKSPDDRTAKIRIGCEWWANAYINGEVVRSYRLESRVEKDGDYFHRTAPLPAHIKLTKGINTLLVKCHGGSDSSCFIAYIEDPGDLEIAHKPELLKDE